MSCVPFFSKAPQAAFDKLALEYQRTIFTTLAGLTNSRIVTTIHKQIHTCIRFLPF